MHRHAQQVAPRVAYEIKRLREARRLGLAAQDRTTQVAMLENLLLHARILYDFFTRRRRDLKGRAKSDVVAEDFLDEPTGWVIPSMPFLKEHKDRIHRSLAHLTYHRVEYESNKKIWNLGKIVREVEAAWSSLLQQLPAERREWFGLKSE
jgi:hypothetical protein